MGNGYGVCSNQLPPPVDASGVSFQAPLGLGHVSPPPLLHTTTLTTGHNALMVVVSLSLCPVPDPKSSMESHRKLKIGRNEAHNTGDLYPI